MHHLLLECPGYSKTLHSVFGTHKVPLDVLSTRQQEVLRYLERTGRWRPKDPRVRWAGQPGRTPPHRHPPRQHDAHRDPESRCRGGE